MRPIWHKNGILSRPAVLVKVASAIGLHQPPLTRHVRRQVTTMARNYETALSHLASLQSNKTITSLFSPTPIVPSSLSTTATASQKEDLNALAIPEMLAWLGRAGLNTSDLSKLKCIHVAGTKGKGSVCAYLTSMLTQPEVAPIAGRVGTYTSPHLLSVRERIMLDGQPISQEQFTRYFFEVWDAFTNSARAEVAGQQSGSGELSQGAEAEAEAEADVAGPASKPFYFRFLTIMAFHVFLKEGVRSAVIECGIGGEYDSTNVLPAEAVSVSIVTQLGIDHVGMLGRTLPEIACHKIGVAKRDRVCLTKRLRGEDGESAMKVMRARAEDRGAILVEIEEAEADRIGSLVHKDRRKGGDESLDGQFQKWNQALAFNAAMMHLEILAPGSRAIPNGGALPDSLARGLQAARLRGRCETLTQGETTWLIDGAHTAESLQEVAKWYASKWDSLSDSSRVLVFNQQDRDAAHLLAVLHDELSRQLASSSPPVSPGEIFNVAIFTRNDLSASTPGGNGGEPDLVVQSAAQETMRALAPTTETIVTDNVADAVSRVKASTSGRAFGHQKVVILATGSLHLVGALLRTLEPDAAL